MTFVATNVSCLNVAKSPHPISTGIGYLDHMIDQLNSHAQVGVSVTVATLDANNDTDGNTMLLHSSNGSCRNKKHTTYEHINRYANEDQFTLITLVGSELGKELHTLVQSTTAKGGSTSRFRCPLDEGLVECILEVVTTTQENGKLVEFTLPPYGKYPLNIGRSKIGTLQTKYVEIFFTALAQTSGLHITLRKIRGDNGHHVVESAFKAFSRALRNLIDGVDAYDNGNYNDNGPSTNTAFETMWGLTSESYSSGLAIQRMGKVERSTKETSIMVCVRLFGFVDEKIGKDDDQKKEEKEEVMINTGIQTLNQFITILAREAQMSIEVQCSGDLYVDDHHTSEDVSIALGQALDEALGTRAGLNRMWCATGIYGDAEIEVTMDLSNRPDIHHNLSLSNTNEENAGDLSVEMLIHTLESLAMNSKSTVHIVEKRAGRSALETYYATAMAYGRALRMCSAVDPRRAGKTASSKGTLSV